ncbi:MAG: response regulator [Candidatus Omnitrophota bacterium]
MNKKTVLIIDDEVAFTEMVKLNLEASGRFIVKIENNPHLTVSTALSCLPDVILLDVVMPDIEGPDVIGMFRKEPLLCDIPIIFLTATIRKTEAQGDDGVIGGHLFLAKPCSVDELIQAIDSKTW